MFFPPACIWNHTDIILDPDFTCANMLAKCKRHQANTHALNNSAYILLFGMYDLSHSSSAKKVPC